MSEKSIDEIAAEFGLTVEDAPSDGVSVYNVLKGVNTVATGDESAVRSFLSTYEAERPPLLDGSMYGYKE